MTAYSAVESAVEAMKSGAVDYLIKPLDFDQLKSTLFKTLEHSEAVRSGERFPVPVEGIVGNSPAVRRMLEMIHTVAPSEATVLINGKSGTGKELVARAIHNQSQRKDGPWVAVNCAALTESLLESELFGHEKGAFTGADKRRDGRFLQADGGTLFLDEIGEISLLMQVKLLRAIQQREIQRVGGDATLKVDVRRRPWRLRTATCWMRSRPGASARICIIGSTSSAYRSRPFRSGARTSPFWRSTSSRFSASGTERM